MPALRRSWSLPLVCALVAAVFLSTATISIRTAPDTYPVADTATTSIATLQAARGAQHVGAYSRFGWNHPGPLLYQILAVPYELSGRREIALKWTALALNVAWLGGLLLLVGRRSTGVALAIALALVPLLWREQRLLFSSWNPFVAVLALAFAVGAAADLATGRGWRTRLGPTWLAVALSFCVQAHAGLAIPAAVCALAASLGIRPAVRPPDARGLRSLVAATAIAIVVAAVLWATPLLAEVRDRPGNLATMAGFLTDRSLPRGTWMRALDGAAYMTVGPFLPTWIVDFQEVPHDTPGWLRGLFAALIAATACCALIAHRRGLRYDAALAAVSVGTSLATIVAAKGVVGPLSDYILLWATAIGALDAAVILATLLALVPVAAGARPMPLVRTGGLALACAVAWMVIGGLRLTAKHAEQARDTTLRALATDLQAYCDRHGVRQPQLALDAEASWREAAGLLLQFDKHDRPMSVPRELLYLVGPAFAATGREDATFYLMPTSGATPPPDAPRRDWITTRGAYRIVRIR